MKKIVYIDGIFDLFHRGHLESLIKAKNVYNDPDNTLLMVGIVGDKDAENYKRLPIIKQGDRLKIIESLKIVDNVLCPCPLKIDMNFVERYKIDLVVHSFFDEKDREKQSEFFKELIDNDKFKEIDYYKGTSTSDIINKIKLL